jgi:hypothetical protein
MLDKLIHDYLGVDVTVVWKTIHQDIPTLEKLIGEIEKLSILVLTRTVGVINLSQFLLATLTTLS